MIDIGDNAAKLAEYQNATLHQSAWRATLTLINSCPRAKSADAVMPSAMDAIPRYFWI